MSEAAPRDVVQIQIEAITEDDGSVRWLWDAFGEALHVCGGGASTLSDCIDSMRQGLIKEG